MAKTLTPLVINTGKAHAPGRQFQWNELENPKVFIRGIATQAINLEGADLGRLISGVPTPFARAAMFQYAIASSSAGPGTDGALLAFYRTLQDEWKGLVACLALDNQDVTVQRIDLVYSDGKDRGTTANLYEPTGALQSMLFDEKKLWCDPSIVAENQTSVPYLYVIKYRGKVIAGTAPKCLLFTSAGYTLNSPKGLTDPKTGKFTDPLKADLGREDLLKLWLYVRHIRESLKQFGDRFNSALSTTLLGEFLQRWLDQIETRAGERGVVLNPDAIKPTFRKMGHPFNVLFNIENTLYGWRGRFSNDRGKLVALVGAEGEGIVEVELDQLLLDPATCRAAEVVLSDPRQTDTLGVHLLKVPVGGDTRNFALPLSEHGLAIFQDSLTELLEGGGDMRSRLIGSYDASSNSLTVKLEVDVNGTPATVTKVYADPVVIQGARVLCWPDFISPHWNKYFLFSELPHNGPELRAFPLRADAKDFQLDVVWTGGQFGFPKMLENGRKVDANDPAELLVAYDMGKLNPGEYRYEIYQSDRPFKAIELQHRDRAAGYVAFRNVNSGAPGALRAVGSGGNSMRPARVGFDFGSNNTCVSYSLEDAGTEKNDPLLLKFRNRRRFLLGIENAPDPRLAATPAEVFFFQNEEPDSNKIKSMIMVHDKRRVVGYDSSQLVSLRQEVKSGFPVFEKNVPVEEATATDLKVRFDTSPSMIKYNMKWSQDAVENAYKMGMLKIIWLKTCAELFDQDLYPAALVWAYPSAMAESVVLAYRGMWEDVSKVNPLPGREAAKVADIDPRERRRIGGGGSRGGGPKAVTEAFAVCRHALVQGVNVSRDAIFLGFDVGGSTTDILVMASRRDGGTKYEETLIKEGSIKLAAGKLADATKESPRFPEVLRNFCKQYKQEIHGVTVPPDRLTSGTAAYYFNLLIDRLDTPEDLRQLYSELAVSCKELFVLNAYMTGLIVFHAGQLAAMVRRLQQQKSEHYAQPFQRVTLASFGKGGRMFDWLPEALSPEVALAYQEDCFVEGYGPGAQTDLTSFDWLEKNPKLVKAEVAFGLAAHRDVKQADGEMAELVGEEGYTFEGAPVDPLGSVERRHLQYFGNQLMLPRAFPRFTAFAKILEKFSTRYFGFSMPDIEQEVAKMNLVPYVKNLPEYQLAQRGTTFDFEAPLIILEGMCFMDTVLMPRLMKK